MEKYKLPTESNEIYVSYVERTALYDGACRFPKMLIFFR